MNSSASNRGRRDAHPADAVSFRAISGTDTFDWARGRVLHDFRSGGANGGPTAGSC
jgi:hypothetical protein